MDAKPAPAPGSASLSFDSISGSSSPPPPPPPYSSSVVVVAADNFGKTYDDDKGSKGYNDGVSSGSSDAGFVSGDEEFETAPERPIVGDPDGGIAGKYEDDEKVGESKVGALKESGLVGGDEGKRLGIAGGEGYVESNGIGGVVGKGKAVSLGVGDGAVNGDLGGPVAEKVEVEGKELKGGEAAGGGKESEVSGGELGKVVYGGSDKLDETEGVKLTSEGDAFVDDIHVDLLAPGVAVVGDEEGVKDSEVKRMEVSVGGGVPMENGFDKITSDAEQPVDLNLESEKTVEPVSGFKVEAPKLDDNGGDMGVSGVEKDGDSGMVASASDGVTEDNQEIPEIKASADENATASVTTGKKKPGSEVVKSDANMEAEGTTDEWDVVGKDRVDRGDGDRSLPIDSVADVEQTQDVHTVESLVNNKTSVEAVSKKLDDESDTIVTAEAEREAEGEEKHHLDEEGDTDEEGEGVIFGSSEAAKKFLEELERGAGVVSHSAAESSNDHSHRIDGQIVTDSDEEVDTDEEGEGKELFDSAALTALLKAATGGDSDGGTITVTSQDGTRLFSVERPAGLGSSLRSVRPPASVARSSRPNLFSSSNLTSGGDSDSNLSEEERKKLENLQQIKVKFLRLVHRLGLAPEESIAAQVLYRLSLLAGRVTPQAFSDEAAKRTALQVEEEGKDDLNFSLNILVLGKAGVGKSATINSIFGEEKSSIHAFEPATTSVKEITGVVDGVKIRVIDCPGLKSSGSGQGANRKVLSSVKKFMKKCPPDIVLYVDRLDTQTRDLNDLPLLRSITSALGSSIWRNAIVTLTHAASAPPDGPSGNPLSYEVFVAQRSHVVQQSVGQAVGDLRIMNPGLMSPVSLVENHSSCRKNKDGHKVLPNGHIWRPQLLLLCYSMKIISEASSISRPQDPFDHRKLFGFRTRSPPLPYLLSWLLQSRSHPKLSTDQGVDNVDSDVDLGDLSDSDQEEEDDEYDQLPPFKPLRRTQLAKLSKEQKKAYFEEYDYRVKLLQKKQWREELRRMREIKKKGKAPADEYGYLGEDVDPENGGPAAVPVALPDMALPPSFDSDNPAYRYRFLEPTSQFLARPVLDTHGWDHDCGYDGVNVEHSLALANQFPAAVTVQVTKDKKEFSIHLDSSISAKHGENGSSMAGFDIQNVGKQLAYILRGETKFKNFKKNKTAAGVSVTFLGENVATGVKLEDQISLGKRIALVGSTGTVRSQSDAAYGANLEVRLRDADYPIGQDQSTLGFSLVKWRADLAVGANLQSQFSVGRSSKVAVRAGLNNKMSGQISIRTSSSDQLQIALVGLLPIGMAIYKSIRPEAGESYSMY